MEKVLSSRYFPPVWEKIDELIEQENLVATEEVLFELEKKDDDVYEWACQRQDMFIPTDNEEIQQAVADILRDHGKLIDQRKTRTGADPFVIALAQIQKCAVLSGERRTDSKKRPNIPDVCAALGIRCINMLQLFREQGWVFQ